MNSSSATDLHPGAPEREARRTRLAPSARRAQILDAAAQMILSGGLAAFSMEQTARRAGVSKSLIHKYFPTRATLFSALLQREFSDLRARGATESTRAAGFEELISRTTRLFLQQTEARGPLVQALLADPAVASLMQDEHRRERERTLRYFTEQVRSAYDLPEVTAKRAVDLLMAVTGQGGVLVSRGEMTVPEAEAICVTLILGGLRALADL